MTRLASIVAWLLSAAAAAPPPPPVLQPYIHDGRFDPGDYGWMRGRFEDAMAADQAANHAIQQWLGACFAAGRAETVAQLQALEIAAPKLDRSGFGDRLCEEVATQPYPLAARRFADFQQSLALARPVADSYLAAVALAEQLGGPRGPTLADQLLARALGEQMLRYGLEWGSGEFKAVPPLTPDARAIVIARIGIALRERDHTNTEWLKDIVAKQGWPKISQVGERASAQAWLLVQHADADPAFQLRALRLMEPLVATGEVSKRNYAYLYDRVMLKLTGRQRYGTQGWCRDGKLVPQPLEDEAAVDRLRSQAGLDPLSVYMEQLRAFVGPCPPAPPPPPPAPH